MIVEIGHYALALALGVSVIQTVVPFWGVFRQDRTLASVGASAALISFALVALSFAALVTSYVRSDFSVANVAANSHSAQPLIYKFTSVWGNHEGSMLLWVLILTLFGALVALSRRSLPPRLRAGALAAQGLVAVAFLAFTLLTSNPFQRLSPAPAEGQDLNPILQDLGLAIHPPLLYVGYVGFSITYAFAVAALIDGRIDAMWARAVRPWTLLAWTFLTLGIAMGSYWAYYELGWGGWWFWDPVENASFMPWLAGTALIHSTVVMEKRDALKVWTILLAILTFSLSLLGTFIVRSGVLTSVHSFATEPARGLFILFILIFFVGGSLALFAWRAPLLRQGGLFAPVSRESALVVNNVFLATACATVFVGTLYPLLLELLTGDKISVGPPFYNATFVPVMVPLLLLMPIGQSLAWKRGDLLGAAQRNAAAFGLAVLAALALIAMTRGGPVLAPLGVGLGLFLVLAAGFDLAERIVTRASGPKAMLSRARGLPRSAWGTAFAHAGLGLSIIGIAAAAWSSEAIAVLKPGERLTSGRYTVVLEAISPRTGPNFRAEVARFRVFSGDRELQPVEASKRVYTARSMPTTEAGIRTDGLSQAYIGLGEVEGGGIAVRLHDKPLILLIWIGALVMAFGGGLSLTDRRFRLAAPRRAAPAAVAEPAE
ncbi:heme lyase CcmF/NrfE family subunit [Bosea sp. (in: a-proteobacteria)]|uniref:heme lyase CcmF/NrfE family subunit n=1 Tax=Bosea sp. (in: a-proteobacteria) TaxID=1871050 RepID=UPI00262BA4A6|nr:heme lyase CcmF/NrfE family subunit [Bosea sp. (in: a-proteobacteria)]MCO5092563.1 heme lyase CcmF/NrfE family subunit [Bosea sp. (in: a-proteobacteria)]